MLCPAGMENFTAREPGYTSCFPELTVATPLEFPGLRDRDARVTR